MPVRLAKLAAVCVMVAVISSAAMTCVPGSMRTAAMRMPACSDMGSSDRAPAVTGDLATACCVRHEPALTAAKIDLHRVLLDRVALIAPLVAPMASVTVFTHHAPQPPGLASTLGPPAYITLSTLRI